MKIKLFLITYWIIISSAGIPIPKTSPVIQIVSEQIRIDSLKRYVKILSGEINFFHEGSYININNRWGTSFENNVAADYIEGKLRACGFVVNNQNYSAEGRNIYAIQYGKVIPDSFYLIGAHYDNVGNAGADDNASGCAAVIEAARVLSQHDMKYSVIYAFFDEEESQMIGSKFFTEQLRKQKRSVLGAIILDMIAYDSDNDGTCEIHIRNIASSISLAKKLKATSFNYNIDLNPEIVLPGSNRSDHSSFWNYYYSSVLLIESMYGKDFNKYYHSKKDLIEYFNFEYFHRMSLLAITSLAECAEPIDYLAVRN